MDWSSEEISPKVEFARRASSMDVLSGVATSSRLFHFPRPGAHSWNSLWSEAEEVNGFRFKID